MKIDTRHRFCPFTHRPGTLVQIPCTHLVIKIFPTRFELYDWALKAPVLIGALEFGKVGPFNYFTLKQDLERGRLTFLGYGNLGQLSFHLQCAAGGIELSVKKAPPKLSFSWEGELATFAPLKQGERFLISINSSFMEPPSKRSSERLFLGCSKTQVWEKLPFRSSLEEVLPLWHRLGVLTPEHQAASGSSLYDNCRQVVQRGEILEVANKFQELFSAGFTPYGIMVPELADSSYHGYSLPPILAASPLALLFSGASLIRSLFCSVDDKGRLAILPALPPQFHAGRLTGVEITPGLTLDLEWSKKRLKRLHLHVSQASEINLLLPCKRVKTCRLRKSKQDRGVKISLSSPLELQEKGCYYLDQFRM